MSRVCSLIIMNFFFLMVLSLMFVSIKSQNLETIEAETRDLDELDFMDFEDRQVQGSVADNLPVQPVSIPSVPQTIVVSKEKCHWSGTSPFCMGKCGSYYYTVASDSRGNGRRCWTGLKKYCCPKKELQG